MASAVFEPEPSLLRLEGDFVVVGDLNGGIVDLLRILHYQGSPANQNYLFLGNLVNGGEFSIQVLVLVLISKILFPTRVFVLRGSEEFPECCAGGGFKTELDLLYGSENRVFHECLGLFGRIPLAAVVNNHFFCVSGGIGPSIMGPEDIDKVARPPKATEQVLLDVCWSEPSTLLPMYLPSYRGLGNLFGVEAVRRFLARNELGKMIRTHTPVDGGCELGLDDQLISVFSTISGNSRAGAAVLSGKEWRPVSWPGYERLRITDVALLTSIQEDRFVIPHSLSASAGLAGVAQHSVPACQGLRLTVSKTGMPRTIQPRSRTIMESKSKPVLSPLVKKVNVSFSMSPDTWAAASV
jgi:protein phosphatase